MKRTDAQVGRVTTGPANFGTAWIASREAKLEFWARGEWTSQKPKGVLEPSKEIIVLFAGHMGVGDCSALW